MTIARPPAPTSAMSAATTLHDMLADKSPARSVAALLDVVTTLRGA
jgi:hypothetical protein